MLNHRSTLGLALQDKIIRKDKSAIELINLILRDHDSTLDSVDIRGKSFLHNALEVGFKAAADHLLSLQIKNTIIFMQDKNLQTCLFLAAKQGYHDIVDAITRQAIKKNESQLGYNIWLTKDDKGYTPLHIASLHHCTDVVELLLSIIVESKNAINNINNTNEDGNMPLHLACINKNLPFNEKLLNMLIQQGADLDTVNKKGQTSLELISNYLIDHQIKLFELLGKKQDTFLNSYRKYSRKNRQNEILMINYHKLFQSYNKHIYQSAKNHFDKKMQNQYGIEPTSDETPKFITEMPIADAFYGSDDETSNKNENSLLDYQHLQKDQDTIKKLIEDTENYLQYLNNKPLNIVSHFALISTVAIVSLLSYVAIETWLGISHSKYNNLYIEARRNHDPNKNEYFHLKMGYEMGTIFFGVFGFFCNGWY